MTGYPHPLPDSLFKIVPEQLTPLEAAYVEYVQQFPETLGSAFNWVYHEFLWRDIYTGYDRESRTFSEVESDGLRLYDSFTWGINSWLTGFPGAMKPFAEFTADDAYDFYERSHRMAKGTSWGHFTLERQHAIQVAYKEYIEGLDRDLEEFYYPPFASQMTFEEFKQEYEQQDPRATYKEFREKVTDLNPHENRDRYYEDIDADESFASNLPYLIESYQGPLLTREEFKA